MKFRSKGLTKVKNACVGLSNSSSEASKGKAYKKLNFVLELVKFFKTKGDFWVSQDELLEHFISLNFSRSYVYLRLKKYSQGVVKRHFGNDKPDILEPLIVERSRLELDGIQGVIYKLNEEWKTFSAEEVRGAFNGN